MTPSDLKALSDTDWAQLIRDIQAESTRRDTLATAHDQQTSIASSYADAVANDAAIPAASVPDAIGPGVAIIWTDGNQYRNKSGAWLPQTATPATYPLGWTQETGLPPSVDVWSPTATYKVGDLASYNGATYRCIQPASPNPTWTPDVAVSLWTLA